MGRSALLALLLVGCATGGSGGKAGPTPSGKATSKSGSRSVGPGLMVRCDVADSRLFIDGELQLARCGPDARRYECDGGPHRFEVRHEGYFAYQKTINVLARGQMLLEIALHAVPPLRSQDLESEAPP